MDSDSSDEDELLRASPILDRKMPQKSTTSAFDFETLMKQMDEAHANAQTIKAAESFKLDEELLNYDTSAFAYTQENDPAAVAAADEDEDEEYDDAESVALVELFVPCAADKMPSAKLCACEARKLIAAGGAMADVIEVLQQAEKNDSDLLTVLAQHYLPKRLAVLGLAVPSVVVTWLLRATAFHPNEAVSLAAARTLEELSESEIVSMGESHQDQTAAVTAAAAAGGGLNASLVNQLFAMLGAPWLSENFDTVSDAPSSGSNRASAKPIVVKRAHVAHELYWGKIPAVLRAMTCCLNSGWHTLTSAELVELAACWITSAYDASMNVAVPSATCETVVAALDAIPAADWTDTVERVIDRLIELKAYGPRNHAASWSAMVRNIPIDSHRSRQLIHAAAYRALSTALLQGTSYAKQVADITAAGRVVNGEGVAAFHAVAFAHVKAALSVLLQEVRQGAGHYERESLPTDIVFAVLICVHMITCAVAAGDVTAGVLSWTGSQMSELKTAAEGVNYKLKHAMQADVQASKDLIIVLIAQVTPYLNQGRSQGSLKGFGFSSKHNSSNGNGSSSTGSLSKLSASMDTSD